MFEVDGAEGILEKELEPRKWVEKDMEAGNPEREAVDVVAVPVE